MLDNLFTGIFGTTSMEPGSFIVCILVSLLIGVVMALTYGFRSRYTQSFMITLTLLPTIVCVIIMMVNGNVGAGVAVAGAFSLVRFRSLPGTARDIGVLFMAMAAGLITGMGYLGYAVLYTLILCGISMLYMLCGFGKRPGAGDEKVLRITIPEDLDYTDVFTDLLRKYTAKNELVSVKTSNMGSLYKLTYEVVMSDNSAEKEFLDALRCRNGNLEISMSRQDSQVMEL